MSASLPTQTDSLEKQLGRFIRTGDVMFVLPTSNTWIIPVMSPLSLCEDGCALLAKEGIIFLFSSNIKIESLNLVPYLTLGKNQTSYIQITPYFISTLTSCNKVIINIKWAVLCVCFQGNKRMVILIGRRVLQFIHLFNMAGQSKIPRQPFFTLVYHVCMLTT